MNSPLRLLAALVLLALAPSVHAENIKVLIVDGQNNHNWAAMTPINKATLERAGLFTVEVSTTPKGKNEEEWAKWRPDFSKYDVVVSNYNGHLWPEEVQKSFTEFVAKGGGFVVIHAANNSFGKWREYNEMIGIGGWGGRNEKSGPYLRFEDGKVSLDHSKGRGGSHGRQHAFQIVTRNAEHPITKGLPLKWMHARDELYDSLRGPVKNLTLLATAYSEKSKRHEPMMMTIRYEKGRVFHTPMGHVDPTDSIRCVGFQTVLVRGTEWAATGKVTTIAPANFPGEDKVSMADPKDVEWGRIKTALKFSDGSCCAKARAGGNDCAHPCCAKAIAKGQVCAKCNPTTK